MAITRLVSGMPASYGGTPDKPPVYETTYEGAVLDTYERNMHDDSDFYAIVWDAEEGSTKHVMYATTRGWTYCNGATIDATPEVRAAAAEAMRRAEVAQRVWMAAEEARVIEPGKRVVAVKGRKVPVGTEGDVFWVGPDKFKSSRWGTEWRVGIETDDGERVFTAADNLEVVNPEQYEVSPEEVEASVPPANPDRTHWRVAVALPCVERARPSAGAGRKVFG